MLRENKLEPCQCLVLYSGQMCGKNIVKILIYIQIHMYLSPLKEETQLS